MHPDEQFQAPFCQWTCPICGITRVCVRNDSACGSVSNNLLTHVRATNDVDHGPQGDVPPEIDPADLDEYVVCNE